MHPPISRYTFNILYNVMIRLINYERFSTNDVKLIIILSYYTLLGDPMSMTLFSFYYKSLK